MIKAVFIMTLFLIPLLLTTGYSYDPRYIIVKSPEVVSLSFTSNDSGYGCLVLGNHTLLRMKPNSSSLILLNKGYYTFLSNDSKYNLSYKELKPSGALFNIPPKHEIIQQLLPYSKGSPFNFTIRIVGNSTFSSYLYNYSLLIPISHNKTWVQNQTHLNPGNYEVIVQNLNNYSEEVCVSYSISPFYVNPYIFTSSSMPIGLASYGILNQSGNVTTYEINTTSLLGYLNITYVSALNQSQRLVNPSSVSFQLNGIVIKDDQDYFVQDVLVLYTGNESYYLSADVFNLTNGEDQLIYTNSTNVKQYTLPLESYIIMNVSQEGDDSVLKFGFINLTSGKFTWFSNYDLGNGKGFFSVNGNKYTPGNMTNPGVFYDAELVIGGGGDGETTTMTKYSGWIALLYLNGSRYSAFPSYYSFGEDTKEAVSNIYVVYLGYGEAYTYEGEEHLTYLHPRGVSFPLPNLFHVEKLNVTSFPETSTLVRGGINVKEALAIVAILAISLSLLVYLWRRK